MIAVNAFDVPASVFGGLIGAWQIQRTITPDAKMTGEAVFSLAGPDELSYREQGELLLASGQALQAERRYVFRSAPAGFAVFFAEPPFALFHAIVLTPQEDSLIGRATHGCGDDFYVSEYRFWPHGGFSIRHEVKGPRKDYASFTEYRRA